MVEVSQAFKRQNNNKSPPPQSVESEKEEDLDNCSHQATQGSQTDSGGDDSSKENKENANDIEQSKNKKKGTGCVNF